MRESDTYMMIFEEGLEKGLEKGLEEGLEKGLEEGLEKGALKNERKLILRYGQNSFGLPDEAIMTALESITDVDRLDRLLDLLIKDVGEVKNWQELLATP